MGNERSAMHIENDNLHSALCNKYPSLLFLENDLRGIPDINKLAVTLYGNDILLSLAYEKEEEGFSDEKVKKTAVSAFQNYASVKNDFAKQFEEIRKKAWKRPAVKGDELEAVLLAFGYAMYQNKADYKEEDDFARGMANRKIDCDLTSFLLIDCARGVGISLLGVDILLGDPGSPFRHYLAAYKDSSGTMSYIEATGLLNTFFGENYDYILESLTTCQKKEQLLMANGGNEKELEKVRLEIDALKKMKENYFEDGNNLRQFILFPSLDKWKERSGGKILEFSYEKSPRSDLEPGEVDEMVGKFSKWNEIWIQERENKGKKPKSP
jgi:hypothetical protein